MDNKFDIMRKEHKMLDLKLTETQKDIKTILQNMKNSKEQKHEKYGSNISITLSRNSKSLAHWPKGTQYPPFIMYPPREKIEMMKYDIWEDQCVAWLNKEEEYFGIYNITMDEEKVKYASMHLEGYA